MRGSCSVVLGRVDMGIGWVSGAWWVIDRHVVIRRSASAQAQSLVGPRLFLKIPDSSATHHAMHAHKSTHQHARAHSLVLVRAKGRESRRGKCIKDGESLQRMATNTGHIVDGVRRTTYHTHRAARSCWGRRRR